jgi:hypothetical protein
MENIETYTESKLSYAFESIIRRNSEKFGRDFVHSFSEAQTQDLVIALLKKQVEQQALVIEQLSRKLNHYHYEPDTSKNPNT